MTRFAAIPLLGVGLTLGAFGVIRGAMDPGPAEGERIVLAISPPVSEDARAIALEVVKDRVEEKGMATRVTPAGDQIVVELGDTDAEIVRETTALLLRTAKLELHVVMPNDSWPAADVVNSDDVAKQQGLRIQAGAIVADDRDRVRGSEIIASYVKAMPALAVPQGRILAYGLAGERAWRTYLLDEPVLVSGNEITHVELGDHGVLVDLVADAAHRVAAQASTRPGNPLAVVLDGKVKFTAPLPATTQEPVLHLHTAGASDDAWMRDAIELRSVIEAGAVRPLSVVTSAHFTRAVGFIPRAWPFLALALVSLVAGWFVWKRRA